MLSEFILTIACLTYALLAFLVLRSGYKVDLNRVYGALLLIAPAWILVVFLEDVSYFRGAVDTLARLDYALATILIILFYFFCTVLSKKRWHLMSVTVLLLGVLTFSLSMAGSLVTAHLEGNNLVLIPQTGYLLFIFLMLVAVFGGLAKLGSKYFVSRGREKSQIIFVALGLFLTAIGLIVTLVIAPRLFDLSGANVTRFGLYSTLFFAGFSTYAVIRHRFMDIRVAAARGLAYLLILITMICLYVITAFSIVGSFFESNALTDIQSYAYVVSAVFLAFTYAPLKKFFDQVTDKIFFHNDYHTQDVLKQVGDVASNEIDLEQLSLKSMNILRHSLKTSFVGLYIASHNKNTEPLRFSVGALNRTLPTTAETSLLTAIGKAKNEIITIDQLSPDTSLYREMNITDTAVIVRLETSHELIGHLFLGPKQNGNAYYTRDIQLLSTIADELALAVQNSLRFQEINEINTQLQQRIDKAVAKLQDSNQKLRLLDTAKDEFISMASHQLRTPLTSIKGYVSMVLDGDAGTLKPAQRKLLQEAFNSSQRMVYLIGDFLNVSRLETGKFVLEKSKLSLSKVIKEEIDQLMETAKDKKITIEFKPPANFPFILADETKLRQVIMNFLDNAVFYSLENTTVIVQLTHNHSHAIMKIKDQGIGVPAHDQHKLFTKFFRAPNARKHRPDGTGIGLFMAKKVIVAHGGALIFESIENEGSTFGFQLPIN